MTWVVGLTGYPTGGYLISDVRISLRMGRKTVPCTAFGVQKVHWVAPYVAAGFAGSVRLGFFFLNDMRHWATAGLPDDDDVAVSPCKVAYYWRRRARRAWKQVAGDLKAAGLELLVIGVSPQSFLPFNVSHGFILRAPDFELERLNVWEARAIGSGNQVGFSSTN